MPEDRIPRSPEKLDPATFKRLFSLTTKCPWLQPKTFELINLWNFGSSTAQKRLIEKLLRRFTYLTSKELGAACESIRKQITRKWLLQSNMTTLTAANNNSQTDGSISVLHALKSCMTGNGNWKESNFVNGYGASIPQLKAGQSIVIVEDFVGSGNKVLGIVGWFQRQIQSRGIENVKIYTVSVAMLQSGQIALQNAGVTVFARYILRKGISDYHEGTDLENAIQSMEALEEGLATSYKTSRLPNFGYERSEALFSLEPFRVPNNVFPLFWWPLLKTGRKRKTLLKRF